MIAAALLTAPALARADAFSKDPATLTTIAAFNQVCLANAGHPDRIRAWAADHKVPNVTAPAGREIFVGTGQGGDAWFFHTQAGNTLVLSLRANSNACTIYADRAEPAGIENLYRFVAHLLGTAPAQTRTLPDRDEASQYGRHIAHGVLITGAPAFAEVSLMMMSYANTGGPYQAMIQIGAVSR